MGICILCIFLEEIISPIIFISKIINGKKNINEKLERVIKKKIKTINTKKWRADMNIFFEIKIVFALQNPQVLNNLRIFMNEDLLTQETLIFDDK